MGVGRSGETFPSLEHARESRDEHQVAQAVEHTINDGGRLDVLVNRAGTESFDN